MEDTKPERPTTDQAAEVEHAERLARCFAAMEADLVETYPTKRLNPYTGVWEQRE